MSNCNDNCCGGCKNGELCCSEKESIEVIPISEPIFVELYNEYKGRNEIFIVKFKLKFKDEIYVLLANVFMVNKAKTAGYIMKLADNVYIEITDMKEREHMFKVFKYAFPDISLTLHIKE